MEFRLFYEGPLPSSNKRTTAIKVAIRHAMHAQLKSAWNSSTALEGCDPVFPDEVDQRDPRHLGVKIRVGHREFVPLASKHLSCEVGLDIVFLRPEPRGSLFVRGGDIDNRIKTLVDGLRVPSGAELQREIALEDDSAKGKLPDPCYCLMDDDEILTRFSVVADQLHAPSSPTDCVLLINVSITSTSGSIWNPYTGA